MYSLHTLRAKYQFQLFLLNAITPQSYDTLIDCFGPETDSL